MSKELRCYSCGASLAALSLPISRRDLCPSCSVHLHVCRMCEHFDASVARQCLEDDAEDVVEKERVNFCEWFAPTAAAFDPARVQGRQQARAALDALFGDGEAAAANGGDGTLDAAEKLFE